VIGLRCPYCFRDEDRVVDSRTVDDGDAVRRRRECLACGRRFTTFEKVAEDTKIVVLKRRGARESFDREKVAQGMRAALKNRPFSDSEIDALAADVEEEIRSFKEEVTSQEIGQIVLRRLFEVDEVGYMRFASVYKGFERLQDFTEEASFVSPAVLEKREDDRDVGE
jgi:transcriptional repressor NrdR